MIYMRSYIVLVLPFDCYIILFSVATVGEQPSPAVVYEETDSCKYIKIASYLVAVIFEMHSPFRNHEFFVNLKKIADKKNPLNVI